jgi:hypothetical protein
MMIRSVCGGCGWQLWLTLTEEKVVVGWNLILRLGTRKVK